jgi:hypothetical protein
MIKSLKRGPGQLLLSNLAPMFQCCSGPFSDIHAKILGVSTLLFLHNTQFNFSLLHFKHCKRTLWRLFMVAQLVACLPMAQAAWVRYPPKSFFLNYSVCYCFQDSKVPFSFFGLCLYHLFVILFPYSLQRMNGAKLVSQCVISTVILLLHNMSSECFIVNPTNIVHILTQRYVYFCMVAESAPPPPPQSLCVRDCL